MNILTTTAAIAMAKAATPLALSYFRKGLCIETKADDSPVTQADRAVEEKLRSLIAAGFPGDGILGVKDVNAKTGKKVIDVLQEKHLSSQC